MEMKFFDGFSATVSDFARGLHSDRRTMMKSIAAVGLLVLVFVSFAVALPAQDIFDAVRSGDLAKVKEIVENNPQLVKARSPRGAEPLHTSASLDQFDITKYLIEKGADINALDNFNLTPLMWAGIKTAKALVENGADIHIETSNGTALRRALAYGKKEVADYLIDLGAKIPPQNSQWYNRMLFDALEGGCAKYVEKCLEQGLDPLYESEAKSTLLHYAAAGNSIDMVNRLLQLGVKPDKKNIYGLTSLHIAAAKSDKSVVEILIKNGLDKNERTTDGKSPFNLAVENKRSEIIVFLKSINADEGPQKFPKLKGQYLGQRPPGKNGVPFAPGIIVPFRNLHSSVVFSPDGLDVYWSIMFMQGTMRMKFADGIWSCPEPVPLMSETDAPIVSPDGNNLFFIARSQVGGQSPKELIFVRKKTASGWSIPEPLPDVINSVQGIHWQVSTDLQGNLYFGAQEGIFFSGYLNGIYSRPVILDETKNLRAHSPYIAPDGSYLIFTSNELEIMFRKKDGTWSKMKGLNEITGPDVICPFITYDGKYMFYLHHVGDRFIPYWVDASFIEDLRKQVLNGD